MPSKYFAIQERGPIVAKRGRWPSFLRASNGWGGTKDRTKVYIAVSDSSNAMVLQLLLFFRTHHALVDGIAGRQCTRTSVEGNVPRPSSHATSLFVGYEPRGDQACVPISLYVRR